MTPREKELDIVFTDILHILRNWKVTLDEINDNEFFETIIYEAKEPEQYD